jgi:uncharacterized protein (DUF2236 family)
MARPPLPFYNLKQSIRMRVVDIFNDRSLGEAPIARSADAMFQPNSVAWRVHGDVASMMVGGIASLLMQMLHPAVLAGVWDHFHFRTDMHGRLRRTARFIATTTYGERRQAEALIERVRAIHHRVRGSLPDGTPYDANDPVLLAWVHVTEATSFLDAWIRYGEPFMSAKDQDRYFAEMATIGIALGADPVPRSRAEARQVIDRIRPQLKVNGRTAEIARLILRGRAVSLIDALPAKLASTAAVDLLPRWARRLHGLSTSPVERPLVRAATLGVAQTLRWAFR